MSFDCAVVGLGAMGSATLWRLAARGARVVGVDRWAPPHDRGSSHGESRIIRTAYHEDPAYVPLVQRSFELWRELEASTGISLLRMTGIAVIGAPESEVVAGALLSARTHGLPHSVLDAATASQRFPYHRIDAGEVAVYEPGGGVLDAEGGVAAMLRRAGELGASIATGCAVRRVEVRDGVVRLVLHDGGVLQAARAVVCAGPWLGSLVPDLPVPLWVERQVSAWFPVSHGTFPRDAFPVFIRQLPSGRLVYGLPGRDGASVKLAVHHEGARVDPDAVPREVTAADLAPLVELVALHMRGLQPQPVRAITCMYTNTPDGNFVVQPLPDSPQVIVVSACSGHGYKFAPAIGDAAANLCT